MTKHIAYCCLILMLLSNFTQAQQDTIKLNEVLIQSAPSPEVFKNISRSIRVISKEEISQAPVNSIDEILEYYGGLDLRSRGPMGIQSDVSMRGGSFDQGLLLINGAPVNDPQTGHHNLNLPMMLQNIKKIEILEGSAARWFGSNAYSGGINIISEPSENNTFDVSLKGGQFELFSGGLSANYQLGSLSNNTSIGGSRSGGYTKNTDFRMWQLSHQTALSYKRNELAVQLSYLDKGFGANSFYTPKYPDQYEQITNSFASVDYKRNSKKVTIGAQMYWRRLNDRFELFREDENWYVKQGDLYIHGSDTAGFPTPVGLYPYQGHNYHRTDVMGGQANTSVSSFLGNTAIGIAIRNEKILSNVLGEPMNDTLPIKGESDGLFTHSAARQNYTAFLEHAYRTGNFSISAGFSVFLNSDFGTHFSPGIDLGYFVSESVKLFVSANKAIRIPTFTDLYYQGPSHMSNPNLKPEEAISTEGGIKYFRNSFHASVSAFYRIGNNTIDWVKPDFESKWETQNITSLNTLGVSLSAHYSKPNTASFPLEHIGISYTYVDADKEADEFISLYALDYLRHNLNLVFQHKVISKLSMSWTFSLQQRNGNYYDYLNNQEQAYELVHLVNTKVQYRLKNMKLFVEASNLLNQSYMDIGNIPQPGIWVMGGLDLHLNISPKK